MGLAMTQLLGLPTEHTLSQHLLSSSFVVHSIWVGWGRIFYLPWVRQALLYTNERNT